MNSGINRRELTFKALAGLAGGALGWLPVEITSHGHSLTEQPTASNIVATFISMAILSGLIGGLIIAAEGQTVEITPQSKRRFARGFVVCSLLSLPATYYSNLAFNYILSAGGWGINQAGSPFYLFIARVTGWTLMGVMLGAGVGLASFSLPNLVKGAVGGWLGGFLGGMAFDFIGQGTSGLMSRLIGFSGVGLAIGLLIGLVQELTKAAWLSVEAGRLRGRQYRLERAVSTLGRAEENSVGLFGDPSVLPRHAEIARRGDAYAIKSLTPQQGVFLNGGRIESAELHDGDRIKLGNYELAFHLRRAPLAAPRSSAALPPQSVMPAAAAGESPCLVDIDGRRFPIARGAVTRLGRALDNDIVVNHASVSRYHASIASRDGSFRLTDLNSRNGTYRGEQRVGEAQLSDGDSIRLGDTRFTFRA